MVPDKWIRNKSDERAVDEGCTFDIRHAEKVRKYLFTFCRQSIDQWFGKPLELLEWQWDRVVAPLYSWRQKSGHMRYRIASIWCGKSNGKTTLAGGLSLFELCGTGRKTARVIHIANTIQEAETMFQSASAMVENSPELDELLWIRRNINTIEFETKNPFQLSTLKIISGDKVGKRGSPVSAVFWDELGATVDRLTFETIWANVKKRNDPPAYLMSISTAGYRDGIGKEYFDYANKVQNSQIIDTSFLPCVYAADPGDAKQWDSIDVFKKANPSYGITIDANEVEKTIQEVKNDSKRQASYFVERLNLWSGFSTQWLSNEKWMACKQPFKEEDFHGCQVWVGLDAARVHDLFCYVILAEREGKLYLMPRFFIPEKFAQQKEDKDRVPYRLWSEGNNNLYLTGGDVIDPSFVRAKLKEDSQKFRIVELGYDNKFMEDTRQTIEAELGIKMVAVKQSASSLGGAASFFERSVINKTIVANNDILDWCVSNVKAKETCDGLFLDKQAATQRIDGVSASVIALNRFLARDQIPAGASYLSSW